MLCLTSLPVLATASLLLSASLTAAAPHSFQRSGAHQSQGRRAPSEPKKRSSWVLSQSSNGSTFFDDWNVSCPLPPPLLAPLGIHRPANLG